MTRLGPGVSSQSVSGKSGRKGRGNPKTGRTQSILGKSGKTPKQEGMTRLGKCHPSPFGQIWPERARKTPKQEGMTRLEKLYRSVIPVRFGQICPKRARKNPKTGRDVTPGAQKCRPSHFRANLAEKSHRRRSPKIHQHGLIHLVGAQP